MECDVTLVQRGRYGDVLPDVREVWVGSTLIGSVRQVDGGWTWTSLRPLPTVPTMEAAIDRLFVDRQMTAYHPNFCTVRLPTTLDNWESA